MSELNTGRVEVQLGEGGKIISVDRKCLANRLTTISQCAKIIGRRPGEPCTEGGGMSLEWAYTIIEAKEKYNSPSDSK